MRRGFSADARTPISHSMASNLIVIKTELAAERVSRMLYIPKMVGEEPLDKLIKITVDGAGVQESTREYVG